ncbi:DUF58 domain-containing protein [Microbacterium schleiferi]|uniref:DUF58 domain-containing protein n=1 Tax=Microbacterium schleiferi TaxID=69362 RepID=A0A7S8MXA9_9MICO|nr:DUF58 domain-containing protein [Microbacterium schleiferi]QPE04964.1 DUF58 domain-containing protein [Microbacterium schleiferi]
MIRRAVDLWSQRVVPTLRRLAVPLRIGTALGWSVAALAVASTVFAAVLGWAEMLAIAVVCAAVLVIAVPFVLRSATYRVTVELASSRVVVGEPAAGRLVVRNVAHRRSPSTRVQLPVGQARPEFAVPGLAPDAEHDELFTIPTQRRAVLTLGPVTSVRSDPLGLLQRRVTWSEPTELYVHPRVVPLDGDTTGILRDLEGLPTRDLADDDVSFHALREYVPGDDLRHVHWRSTARTGVTMIRQFEQTRRSHLVVALSTNDAEYASDDEFELAVSVAGSVGLSAIRDGKTVTFLTPRGALAVRTAGQLLDELAGVETDPADRRIGEVGRSVVSAAASASVVLFVTGSAAPPADIRAASLRVPPTVRPLCLRAAPDESLSRRALGDLAMVSVPDLPALRRGMRAVTA